MKIDVVPVEFKGIESLRDLYRQEMNCQIVHDSNPSKKDCSQSYRISVNARLVGYGCVWIGSNWMEKDTIFEFFLLPIYRTFAFELFQELRIASRAARIQAQSNDSLLSLMLHEFSNDIVRRSILFRDWATTTHSLNNTTLRRVIAEDSSFIFKHQVEPVGDWLLKFRDEIVATGGILYHYNRPYGDIFMEVAEPFRKRGFGSYLVQELKRICYESGSIPAARCDFDNVSSRATLQRAGFAPCGHILNGSVSP